VPDIIPPPSVPDGVGAPTDAHYVTTQAESGLSNEVQLGTVIARGLASARPAANSLPAGALYFSTDTGVIERTTGSAWESYSGAFVPLAGGTMTGELIAPDFKASGLTGAASASRYVGATTGGPPSSGTFAVGDYVIDRAFGFVWVCTTAGTPGTWKCNGTAIAASSLTSNQAHPNADTNFADFSPTLTLAVPVPPVPFHVDCYSGFAKGTLTAGTVIEGQVNIVDDATAINVYGVCGFHAHTSSRYTIMHARAYLTAASLGVNVGDTFTFRARWKRWNASNAIAIDASATAPLLLKATLA
jgi:hypothetical protein